jgi:hypothetical protein
MVHFEKILFLLSRDFLESEIAFRVENFFYSKIFRLHVSEIIFKRDHFYYCTDFLKSGKINFAEYSNQFRKLNFSDLETYLQVCKFPRFFRKSSIREKYLRKKILARKQRLEYIILDGFFSHC